MKRRIGSVIAGCLAVLALVLASCASSAQTPTATATATPTSTTTATSTGQAHWWDKFGVPEYGGAFTLAWTNVPPGGDPYFGLAAPGGPGALYLQVLAYTSWVIDRESYPPMTFGNMGIPGGVLYDTLQGELAESWETPDPLTIIFHIRKGVYWHSKPPVNGREFTASDIVYHWQRMLGLGSGYTKPSQFASLSYYMATQSITATDEHTVVWKLSQPSLDCLETLLDARAVGRVVPREVVEKYGDAQDWNNAVGTGPFILKDYVTSASFSFIKNPNYWGYDERHPENRLPYVNAVKGLVLPDTATVQAALRTGKIDITEGANWEQASSLQRTNPQLQLAKLPVEASSLYLRVDHSPFTDIKVRKALNMAIDRAAIAKAIYGGSVEGTPCGLYNPIMGEQYYIPYDEWPEEVKAGYAYNPEGARKLLAEAGYAEGFRTNCVVSGTGGISLDILQTLKAYFADVGVDMEIRAMDAVSFRAFSAAGKQDQMTFWPGGVAGLFFPPMVGPAQLYSKEALNLQRGNVKDPVWDEMYLKAKATTDRAERAKLAKEMNAYFIAQYWEVNLFTTVKFNLYQPWLKGYSGEYVGDYGAGFYFARWWVDQKLKSEMGH